MDSLDASVHMSQSRNHHRESTGQDTKYHKLVEVVSRRQDLLGQYLSTKEDRLQREVKKNLL